MYAARVHKSKIKLVERYVMMCEFYGLACGLGTIQPALCDI